jgi:diaminopimelate decarboxylase
VTAVPRKRAIKAALAPVVRRFATRRADLPPSHWGIDVRSGRLSVEGVDLASLLERWGSPLHVVDARRLAANARSFVSGGCEVYYSYKTNNIPGVLRYLHARGVGAEVISEYELRLALHLGVPPERILYTGPGKSDASIRLAVERGVGLLQMNSREEIARVAAAARAAGTKARVGLRIVPAGGWSGQFGLDVSSGDALAGYRQALACPELSVVGIHAHRGLEIRHEDVARGFVSQVLDFADTLRAELALELEIIDVGGSLAIPTVASYRPVDVRLNQLFQTDLHAPDPEATLSIEKYVALVRGLVDERYARVGRPSPRIFLEPGRSMTGNTQFLLARVMTVKHATDGVPFAILDAGQNLADGAKYAFHQIFPVEKFDAPKARTYALAGPICTPSDVLCSAWELPELAPGDVLAIMDAGAYFVPFATSFSFPQPAIVMIEEGREKILRRAETFEDWIGLDV